MHDRSPARPAPPPPGVRLRLSLLLLAALLLAAPGSPVGPGATARAAPYPTNECVARKQQAAARFCRAALGAWAKWEVRGNDGRREAAIARAGAGLARRWRDAEQRADRRGVDCAHTTLSADDAEAALAAAAAEVAAMVGSGLDPNDRSQAACGGDLLRAAGRACARLLRAEAARVRMPARDGRSGRRERARDEARSRFTSAWQEASCPTTAEPGGVLARLDGATGDLIARTITAPQVDDTRFTVISPAGTIPYLGRELRPTCMDGSPYHAFVKRGSVNKLLVYYQGGGACWEQLTCSVPTCKTSVSPLGDNPDSYHAGFADRDNPANPFRDWNVVFVPYCSCDVHFGDLAQDYPLHVEHRGYENARAVEKWAREHFVDPDEVFVTGSSAGAYGAWFHAPLLREVWPAARFHVLADAGNGVITGSFLQEFFPHWGFERNIPRRFPELRKVIETGGGIVAYTEAIARRFSDVLWAHYTTAFDGGTGGQTGFFNIMLNDNNPIAALTWWQGSCAFHDQMRAQAIETASRVPANYRYYIGTGSRHTMWGSDKVYTDTTGGVPAIVDWVNAMLASTPEAPDPGWTNVECEDCGLLLPGDPRPSPLQPPFMQRGGDVVIDCGP